MTSRYSFGLVTALFTAGFSASSFAANTPTPAEVKPAAPTSSHKAPWDLSPEERAKLDRQTNEDHADMLKQLGVTNLRPGANGNPAPGTPNPANYDEAKANPYPDFPDALIFPDGKKVTSAKEWWEKRRPQIADAFEREVYGRIPLGVPAVTWQVTESIHTKVGGIPVIARRVIGHVDNTACPSIAVDIKLALVLPEHAEKPVPVLMMFGFGRMPDDPEWKWPGMFVPSAPPSETQLIADGWGYVSIDTSSIQADNGAGLTRGIIGLTNHGQRRTPDQWGALRAWGWGAARGLDFLDTDSRVDSKHVGIEGVSRYGKAALVAMAFEPRFAFALIGSSGEGGVKPSRRNFGEELENLTGAGAYHWMAGNFIKYGAAESAQGPKTAKDLPVESNELIALCAPRPVFISYGLPKNGDALWLDQRGSFMATVAAGSVYRLLGAKDIAVTEDYHTAKMPPYNTGLLNGELAWRQHDGGHEDRSNMKYFLDWADAHIGHPRSAKL